ncbi:MAG: HlyD family efflux transporter periplasmic adaptor subunit [Bacillota bacterium]
MGRPRRRRRTGKNANSQAVWKRWAFVLAAAALLYAGAGWAREPLLSLFVKVGQASRGTVEVSRSADAVIIRDEQVVRSPVKGKIVLLVNEGDKVRVGTVVAEIENPEIGAELKRRLAELNARLARFESENGRRMQELTDEINRINAQLLQEVDRLRKAINVQDHSLIVTVSERISSLVSDRTTAAGELAVLEAGRGDILSEKETVQRQLDGAVNRLEAKAPGAVSYYTDGYESQLSPSRIAAFGPKMVYSLQPKPERTKSGEEVEAGTPVFKLVNTQETFIAIVLPQKDAQALVQTSTIQVRIEGEGRTISFRPVSVGPKSGDDYVLLLASTEEFVPELLNLRRVNVEIVTETYSGVVIPRSALTTIEEVLGVYAFEKAKAKFVPVTVKGGNHSHVVVEGIKEGTEVVLNPRLVREGFRVR